MWQYASAVAKATYDYVLVKILATYNYNANCVVFDGIQVTKEGFGESYEYDGNGNIVKVTDILGQETKYTYENNELTEILSPTNIKTVNTYENHNLKQSDKQYEVDNPQKNKKEWKSFETVKYDYDNCGNLKSTTSTAGGVTKTTSAEYRSGGNFLDYTIDTEGNKTTYGYNLENSTLEWVQYPEDTTATRTEYTYDDMFRLVSTNAHTDTGNDLSAQYTYDGDLLTAITTPSTTYSLAYGDFALRTGVSIGGVALATYKYTTDANHYLEELDFGNDDAVQYTYDKLGRVTQEDYRENGSSTVSRTITYKYDNTGALATMKDSKTGITTKYYYDTVGRTVRQAEIGGDILHKVWYEYDDHGNLKETRECYDQTSYTTVYSYNELTQRLEKIQHDVASEAYTYDDFDRITEKTTKHNSTQVLTETITYHPTSDRVTSLALGTYGTYQYTYDGNGNIISVKKGDKTTTYVYDSANQLIRENNQEAGKTWVWTYDDAGNILSKKEYAYSTGTLGTVQDTISYGYGNATWGDLLTSYDGSTIFYDNIGNPTSDANWSYTWSQGRQLSSMYRASVTWNFTYDANGMRIGRSYGSNVYTYIYSGSQLSYMTYGSNAMKFTYGADGSPLAVDYNGTTYYYVVNLQGDVVAILNSTGQIVVGYTYDAWGRLLTTTGALKDTLGLHNPLRYRGYVYDRETGLYYLQSRYYNPTIGRFINADGYVSTGQGLLGNNMFAYCANNPVNCVDPTGEFVLTAIVVGVIAGAVIGGTVGGVVAYNSAKSSGAEGADLFWETVQGVGMGAIVGGVAGGFIGATGGVVAAYGASSVAGTAMITCSLTMAAKATEVAGLQAKHSLDSGKNNWQVANDCMASIFNNGGKIILPSATKSAGTSAMYLLTDVAKHKVVPLSVNSYLKSAGGKVLPYALTALAWADTVISLLDNDPIARAAQRGYALV